MLQAMVNAQGLDAPGHRAVSKPTELASPGQRQCQQQYEKAMEGHQKALEGHREQLDVCKRAAAGGMGQRSAGVSNILHMYTSWTYLAGLSPTLDPVPADMWTPLSTSAGSNPR